MSLCLSPGVVSIRKLCSVVVQASTDDVNSDVASSSNPLFSLFNTPPWITWVGGAFVVLSVPFYRRIRKAQDQVEATVEEVAETVENMAEKVEKISGDMADALPEGALKEMLLKVEETADRVDQTAEKTQAILEKLDQIEAEVDELIEPLAKEEAALKEREERNKA
ncbi:uncharacterized protein LOC120263729 [Dioscorea cayenensis subsp. rotundata]|uniref:Uncharacterized protein LOC120263729 n=1 Tax=Dioscorea cayennensis subsp. rotundata TaxID=55577 RepID=A0AB40BK66_DIOCR|nr:uncharacterized protein LOC120263729 [Dioscorea cayenensis subsp. rotundata]